MNLLKKKSVLALAMLIVVVLLAWLFWPDRKLAQAKALQNELFSPEAKKLSPEQRREKWQEYRGLREKLTPEQKNALSADARKRRQEEMSRYFAMSPEEKTRHLDEQIRRMEKFRQAMQGNGGPGKGGGNRGAPGSPARGGNSPGGWGAANGIAPGQQAEPGKGDRSVEARDRRRQEFLDSSTPAERAQFTQYRRDLNARRAQLGLPAMGNVPRR